MATLTPEVVRCGPNEHAAFEGKMTLIADLVARGLAGTSDKDRRARAWAMLSVLIGGITVARAMQNAKASDEVAAAVKAAAINAAGQTCSTVPDRCR